MGGMTSTYTSGWPVTQASSYRRILTVCSSMIPAYRRPEGRQLRTGLLMYVPLLVELGLLAQLPGHGAPTALATVRLATAGEVPGSAGHGATLEPVSSMVMHE